MALLPFRVFAYSSCGEFYETKRLAKLDLLSARIPQMGGGVNGAFNKLKKTREMFWSGRPDSNRGPPAPKPAELSLGSPSFSIYFLKTNELEKYLVVAPCTEMWLRMHDVPPISPSAKKQRNTFAGCQRLNKTNPSVESRSATVDNITFHECFSTCVTRMSPIPSRHCLEQNFLL